MLNSRWIVKKPLLWEPDWPGSDVFYTTSRKEGAKTLPFENLIRNIVLKRNPTNASSLFSLGHLLLFGLQWLAIIIPIILIMGTAVTSLHPTGIVEQVVYIQKLFFVVAVFKIAFRFGTQERM